MTGGLLAVGPCVVCGGTFSFNAEKVPSVDFAGARRPVCRDCVPAVNAELERQSRDDRLTILPDSYSIEET